MAATTPDWKAEGEVKAGEYVWRPAGTGHVATAPEGALLLGMFLRPNRFLQAFFQN